MVHFNQQNTLNSRPSLYGLVLAGGLSKRMGKDKAQLCYHGQSQLAWCVQLMSDICEKTFASVSAANQNEALRSQYPQIVDENSFSGPIAGILSAMKKYPAVAWMVIACDLPFLTHSDLIYLRDNRDSTKCATAYHAEKNNLPEPLCAIWEPHSYPHLISLYKNAIHCPRKMLMQLQTYLLTPHNYLALHNVNTPDDMIKTISIEYYAILKDIVGKSQEDFLTSVDTAAALYQELKLKYGFTLECDQLRAAINDSFVDWKTKLNTGDVVVFIPPIAGG